MEEVVYNAAQVIKNYRNKKASVQEVKRWITKEIESPVYELPEGVTTIEKTQKLKESLAQCDELLAALDSTMAKLKADLNALNKGFVLEIAEILADTL